MIAEPVWVTAEEVIAINEGVVNATGEIHLVRNRPALEGAINRPQTYFSYEGVIDVCTLAGYLILAIGKAHAFEQGNKRTAWIGARLFLLRNGYGYVEANVSQERIAATIYEVMSDESKLNQLMEQLDESIEPLD